MKLRRPSFTYDGTNSYITCVHCGETRRFPVSLSQITSWLEGESIQHAMPHLSPSDREMFMTGTCDKCWQRMFPPPEDNHHGTIQ